MALGERSKDLDNLCARIQERIAPSAGRVEYGNLRICVSDWDYGDDEPVTNVALVYETPGGSTDQINITYHHHQQTFTLVDAYEGEQTTTSPDVVLESVMARVSAIPEKRRETLYGEIRRQVDSGSNAAGLFGHLNRFMQSEFKGGTITHIELRDAMTFAVQYMKKGGAPT